MVIFKEIKKCIELSQFVEMKTESGPNIFGEIWTIFMRYVSSLHTFLVIFVLMLLYKRIL